MYEKELERQRTCFTNIQLINIPEEKTAKNRGNKYIKLKKISLDKHTYLTMLQSLIYYAKEFGINYVELQKVESIGYNIYNQGKVLSMQHNISQQKISYWQCGLLTGFKKQVNVLGVFFFLSQVPSYIFSSYNNYIEHSSNNVLFPFDSLDLERCCSPYIADLKLNLRFSDSSIVFSSLSSIICPC